MEIKFTKEEKELFKGNKELLTDYINARAVLEEVKEYNFEEEEKMELNYITTVEKVKFFITKRIEDKINISQEEVTKIYTENKKEFDSQKIQFSEAKKIIENDMLNQQLAYLEGQEISEILNNLEEDIKITKEEIVFSKGNAEVLKVILTNKLLLTEYKKINFEESYKKEIENIENNVLANYYLDLLVRKVVQVTHGEVDDFYNKEKENFENIPQNEAYNQIANHLLSEKVLKERTRIINEIAEKYNVSKLVAENL